MPQQLTFWPAGEQPNTARRTWEDLNQSQREALVVALAKLIGKEAQPASPEPDMEDDHER
ncbi:MAG: hypothetical protein WBF17_05585 [Phycisphaerae bacterium]